MVEAQIEPSECRRELFFIPWIGPTLNRICGGMAKYKRNEHRRRGQWSCIVVKGKIEPFTVPVDIVFTPQIQEKKSRELRYDCTNYAYTTKIIEDGLVYLGILADDSPDHVFSIQINAPIYADDIGMWVELIEADGGTG